ncbi:MAG: tRNA (adenosine(37)-N6)-threonylcarbamoyltransferase complex ATPase subunit type 1 TsaE [Fusobacteriaceae bacterium]|jgi:tRNA threonylcarbamoyladenosine biosynthesis protein TsaE|nr:tRNA (adenosine(37)-N6)-threonylcarbamoyltransferase complex ATPase subunit type 1 TsaE [Fusobacteriaceae bacterium]
MNKICTFAEINEIAEKIGSRAKPGAVIVLTGELGTGKTSFTKALAKGLGISATVKSPTFNYVLEYFDGRLPLYHFDLYRISDPGEIYELGYEEYVRGEGVAVIEWGDLAGKELPESYILVQLDYAGEETRKFSLTFVGEKGEEMMDDAGLGC